MQMKDCKYEKKNEKKDLSKKEQIQKEQSQKEQSQKEQSRKEQSQKEQSQKEQSMKELSMKKSYLKKDSVQNLLETRIEVLSSMLEKMQSRMDIAPEGTLKVIKNNGCPQYYHRTNPIDAKGVYIRKSEAELVQKLAQKEYDKKTIPELQKQIKALQTCLNDYSFDSLESCHEQLNPFKRSLVTPIYLSDDDLLKKWNSITYEKKTFNPNDPEYYTDKHERVRSKSEILIANMLYKMGVPYHYECPIYLSLQGTDFTEKKSEPDRLNDILLYENPHLLDPDVYWNFLNQDIIKIHPDFYCLNVRTRKVFLWEHFGKMGDLDYANKTTKKIATYEKNGFWQGENMLMTFENLENPVNVRLVEKMIQKFLL